MCDTMKMKIGIVGCGSIAKRSVIPSICASDEFDLTAILSKHLSEAQYENVTVYRDPGEFYAHADIDCVYIASPTSLHFESSKMALNHGKHVWCEKSLTTNYSDALELHQIAEANNLAIVENFQFTQHHQLHKVKELIAEQKIGKINLVRATFCFPPFQDRANIRYSQKLGGGALLDAGVYTLKILQVLFGSRIDIRSADLFFEDQEVEIRGDILAICQNTIVAQTYFGFNDTYQCSLEISGTKGRLFCPRIFTAPPGKKAKIMFNDSTDLHEIIEVPEMNQFANMLTHFKQCMRSRKVRELQHVENALQAELLQKTKDIAKCYRH